MQKNQTRSHVKKLGFIKLALFSVKFDVFAIKWRHLPYNVCEDWGMLGFIINTYNFMYE